MKWQMTKNIQCLTQYDKSKCIEVFQLSIKSGCNFCWPRTRNSFTEMMEWRIDKNSEVIKKNDNFQLGSLEECVCRAPEPGLGAVLCNVTPARGAGWQVWRAACVGCSDVNVSTIFPSPLFISPIASPGPWHAVKVATCPYKYHHHLYCQSHKVPVAWALNIRNIKLLFSAPCILWPLPAATDCPRPDSFVRKCSDYGPWTS